jgi:radical SAM superfamily enzyme YgiQ (UPF0313 family)
MNTLLIYPEFPDTFWSFKHALKFVGRKAVSPPLGLLTIASMLPEMWEKRLVDLNVQPLTEADLAWADIVMVSAMAVQQDSAREVLARCRDAGVRTVVGGPLFSTLPDAFAHEADHQVLGEAEITLAPFLADLANGCARPLYATEEHPELDRTPVPAWELADLKQYDSMPLQFSRGCPFNCDFCNVTTLLGHRPRTKSAAQIIAELEALYAAGWRRSVFFVDDNFIGNKQVLKRELLPALIKWRRSKPGLSRRGMPFNTEASINLADDDELVALMLEAGFGKVFIGIETPDDSSLAECGKSQNRRRDLLADVKKLQNAGIGVQAGFIVGFDNDTPSTFQRQIAFIQQSGIVTAMVGLLQAPAGTELYARMKEEGRLLGESIGNNVDVVTNVLPAMGMEALRAGYRQIMAHIYAPGHYTERVKTFLGEYKLPKVASPVTWVELQAFVRSIYELGIKDGDRRHYWDLMLWTLARRPALLPLAVTMAIYGHHFRTITASHIL